MELQREFVHPDSRPTVQAPTVGSYAWHGRHHLAHIKHLLERERHRFGQAS